jgi:hypothetical protein
MQGRTISSGSAKNHNFIGQDGLIHNIYIGDQTGSAVAQVKEELTDLSARLRAKGSRVKILADITRLGHVPLKARTAGLELMRTLDFDRVAIIGSTWVAGGFVNLIITASGRGFQVRCFTDEEDAKIWLQS